MLMTVHLIHLLINEISCELSLINSIVEHLLRMTHVTTATLELNSTILTVSHLLRLLVKLLTIDTHLDSLVVL